MAGKKIRGDCPYCGARQKYCVFPATATFFCYKCRRFGHVNPKHMGLGRVLTRSLAYDPNAAVKSCTIEPSKPLKSSPAGINYLKKRKIDPQPLMNFVRVVENYIVFPFYENKRVVYYVKRKMWGKGRRYDSAEGTPPVFVPYLMLNTGRVVVTEGIFDALRVYQVTGIPALGLLGKAITAKKLNTILRWGKREIDILLDAGEYTESIRYYQTLKATGRRVKVHWLQSKDPAVATRKELSCLLLSD